MLTDLDERKALALGILQIAAAEIPGTSAARQFRGLLEGDKPEQALHMLEEAGEDYPVSRNYWRYLIQAADTLGLRQLRLEFSRRHHCSVDSAM